MLSLFYLGALNETVQLPNDQVCFHVVFDGRLRIDGDGRGEVVPFELEPVFVVALSKLFMTNVLVLLLLFGNAVVLVASEPFAGRNQNVQQLQLRVLDALSVQLLLLVTLTCCPV